MAAVLGIVSEIVLFILLIGFILLVITCRGIIAAIRKIKSEFQLYKYYIVRGAIIGFLIEIGFVVVFQIARQEGLLNKILGTIIFTLIAILPSIFHGGLIGGFFGYLFGKIFGWAGRYDNITDDIKEKLRRWAHKS